MNGSNAVFPYRKYRESPGRGIELLYLPTRGPGLLRQGRDEALNGLGVLDVPEQLPAPRTPDVCATRRATAHPIWLRSTVSWPSRPPSDPGAPGAPEPSSVRASRRLPTPVGGRHAVYGQSDGPVAMSAVATPPGCRPDRPAKSRASHGADRETRFLRGIQQNRHRPFSILPTVTFPGLMSIGSAALPGDGSTGRRAAGSEYRTAPRPGREVELTDAETPDRIVRGGIRRVTLQREERRCGRSRKPPTGVAKTYLVRNESQDRAGLDPVTKLPHPLVEARPGRGGTLPYNGDDPSVREADRGVHRHRPVPRETYGSDEG